MDSSTLASTLRRRAVPARLACHGLDGPQAQPLRAITSSRSGGRPVAPARSAGRTVSVESPPKAS
jgi:hypothetical protein